MMPKLKMIPDAPGVFGESLFVEKEIPQKARISIELH
jgi:hypothetical protein